MTRRTVSDPIADAVASTCKVKANFGFTCLFTPPGYNPKTLKGAAAGYETGIMHFAPARLGGFEVCQYRTAGCTASCLHTAGHAAIHKAGEIENEIELARLARKRMFFQNRAAFNRLMIKEVAQIERRALAHGMLPATRPNGTSDLPWETLAIGANGETILELYPDVQFYDYTKNPKRAIANARGEHPANYHLTFSLAESNADDAWEVLAAGGNVAAVFNICKCRRACKHEIPEGQTYKGYPVINGDKHDLRFLDPKCVIVALKAKGQAKHDCTGFVIRDAFAPRVLPTALARAA